MRARSVVAFVRSGSLQAPYVGAFAGSGVGLPVVPDQGDGRLGLFQLFGVAREPFPLVSVAANVYDCVGNLPDLLVRQWPVRPGAWSVFEGVVVLSSSSLWLGCSVHPSLCSRVQSQTGSLQFTSSGLGSSPSRLTQNTEVPQGPPRR